MSAARHGLVAGIDLGGTNLQAAIVGADDVIIARAHRETGATSGRDAVLDRVIDALAAAAAEAGTAVDRLDAIGIVAPGAVDIPRGVVLTAPNLAWRNVPLRDLLAARTTRPVAVENDVNGAVWGEFACGVGRNVRDLLGVWVGTGVGGGLILDGRLYHGPRHTAGEIGQTIHEPSGGPARRTVEDFAGRVGMGRILADLVRDHPGAPIGAHVGAGDDWIGGTKPLVDAIAQGDELVRRVLDDAADRLGVAIANQVTMLALDMVVVGGGVTEAFGAPFLDRIRASFASNVFPPSLADCRIVMTELGPDAGLVGAALLARAVSS